MKKTILSLVSMAFIAAMTLTSCDEIMSTIDNPVSSYVQFPSTELTLQVGEDRPFQATTISPAKITYKSSDTNVVTIDPQGFVTGIAAGEATLTASVPATEYYAAGEATCKVKVVKKVLPPTDLSTLTADYTAQDGETLTGTLAGNYKISIADGATVTLNGLTINGVDDANCTWAGITCEGDATIILKDGSTNTVKGFNFAYPGIFVPQNKTLTIKGETAGTGKLNAISADYAKNNTIGYGAGIGGRYCMDPAGNIVIEGGDVTATGGIFAAGIGGAYNGGCGTVTITNGVTKVTATGGALGQSIGKAYGICGTVTIGGTVYWDGSAYKNGGDTYLTTATLVYPAEQ
jgi:hypothetical protein